MSRKSSPYNQINLSHGRGRLKRSAADEVGDFGLYNLGINGGAYLEAGRAVTRDDLEYAMDAVDVGLETGDAGCIHTGWGRFFMVDNDKYVAGEPGSELGAAEWLTG